MRYAFFLVALTAVLVLPARGGSATGKPWLWQCTQIHNAEARYRCYVRLLRDDIEASRDSARELGPEILRSGGKAAVRACAQLPTRYRAYTCVHGLGHALLRAYHGDLGHAVRACRALQHAYAPDCAQGVFHDYWISLRGADGTTQPPKGRSPLACCATDA